MEASPLRDDLNGLVAAHDQLKAGLDRLQLELAALAIGLISLATAVAIFAWEKSR